MTTSPAAPIALRGGDEILLGFTAALRAAGVPVTQDRAQAYADAVAILGIDDRAATLAAGRATLCSGPDDLERHDRVFAEWFSTDLGALRTRRRSRPPATSLRMMPADANDPADGTAGEDDTVRAAASAQEVLRHRDVAGMSAAERRALAELFATLPVRLPRRRALRRSPAAQGEVDLARTLRASLRRLGEPAPIHRRRRGARTRRVVLLLDVSGSMASYADPLLRLAHRLSTGAPSGTVEVFSLGTRLTRLTPAIRLRDPDRALTAAGGLVPDWSGGTRLGETLAAFVARWGRRGLARGAVVVVLSDGWERGDTTALAEAVAQLRLLAHRVVWVNPHRGKPGYEPVQAGIAAVLPHVDDLLAGHSLATYEELMEVVRRA